MRTNNSYKILEYNVYGKRNAINAAEASICPCCRSLDINVSQHKEKRYYFFMYVCSECKTLWRGNLYTSKWEYANVRGNPYYMVIAENPEGKRKAIRENEAGQCPACRGKYIEGYIRKKKNTQQYIYVCSDCGTKWTGNLYDMLWNRKEERRLSKALIKISSIISLMALYYHISM